MESKKINQLATELVPDLSDLTIIGDPTTGISKKITLSQMASLFTGTVEEYANLAAFPLVGVADTIYIAKDTNVIYRWDSTAYVVLSPNIIASLVFNDANGFDGTIALVGSVATLTITTALTSGSVPFIGASGALTQDNANLFFDDTNNRLGLGTNAPTTALDVFGSGIIGRLNGTSTNNAYLGFSSAGTNKWSVGNVQSDHRFRIFSEANSAALVSVLQTGEIGIGIANPLTKLHIDGGATALIANLDANVSVAKTLSFRSDNSNRINLEVSGTESGSNAGADLFIRRYSDAGSLIDTPFTITRSTGAITLAGALSGTSATFSNVATATAFIPSGAFAPTNGMYLSAANTLNFSTNTTNRLTITSAGNVGIATDSPNVSGQGANVRVLTVQGLSSTWGGFEAGSTTFENSALIGFYGFTSTTVTGNSAAGMPAYIGAWLSGTSGTTIGSEMRFFTKGNNDLVAQRMVINNLGNIGIGTPTPTDKLHLVGTGLNTQTIILQSTTNTANAYVSYKNGLKSYTAGLTVDVGTNNWLIYDDTAAATRFLISSAGNVGINTSTPTAIFDVKQATNQHFYIGGGINVSGAIAIGGGNDAASANIPIEMRYATTFAFVDAGNETMRIKSGGVVLVNQTSISAAAAGTKMQINSDILSTGASAGYFWENRSGGVTTNSNWYGWYTTGGTIFLYNGAGNIGNFNSSTGNYTATSDINRKKDIELYDKSGLKAILGLKPKLYRMKTEDETVEKHLGFIAQDVKDFIPEAYVETIAEEKDGGVHIGLDYQAITVNLVKAIQELKAELDELKRK